MKIEELWRGWHVDEFVGEGSFGKVYKIVREEFGHKYVSALKVIHIPHNPSEIEAIKSEGLSEDSVTSYFESMVEEIVEEFALMSRLKGNSNIVSYEDHEVVKSEDSIGWDIYIRMEYLTPLYEYLKEHTLTVRDVIQLGIDICQALEVCQKYNIIHRDIKPENIFISDLGKFKLGDFGIAKQLDKSTLNMSKKGTYTYMAPEVYKGEFYDSSVDIYSLGIVLYRFLNHNRSPFLPPYPNEIKFSDKEKANVFRMSGKNIPKPSEAEDGLSEIVLKACAYNSADRFKSATEMRKLLQSEIVNYKETNDAVRIENIKQGTDENVPEKTRYMFAPSEEEQAKIIAEERAGPMSIKWTRKAAELKAKQEAEERARKAAELKAKQQAEERARKAAELKAKQEAEERARKAAELKAKQEAEERARKAAELKAKQEAEERARKTAELKAKQEAKLQAKKESLKSKQEYRQLKAEQKTDNKFRKNRKVAISAAVSAVVLLAFVIFGVAIYQNSLDRTVPKLLNITTDKALSVLNKNDLVLEIKSQEYSDNIELNHIISQNIKGGETVKKNTAIEVIVSLGPVPKEKIEMPNLVNKDNNMVCDLLTACGLKWKVEKEYNSKIKKGNVISQSIDFGESVEKGTMVVLTVSKGKKVEKTTVKTTKKKETRAYVPRTTKRKYNYTPKTNNDSPIAEDPIEKYSPILD